MLLASYVIGCEILDVYRHMNNGGCRKCSEIPGVESALQSANDISGRNAGQALISPYCNQQNTFIYSFFSHTAPESRL
jgi:hypothetical protein